MDLGSILLSLSLLILVVIFIGRPLFDRRAVLVSEEEHNLSALLAERDRILDALAELDFDYELGKIPDEIYARQRESLLVRGAEVLRQLDEQQTDSVGEGDDQIEKAIAERRAKQAGTGVEGDKIEKMIALRRAARGEETGVQFCPSCGKAVEGRDKFCSHCGKSLD